MTMPSGATWIGAHLGLNHPIAACCICAVIGVPAYFIGTSEVGTPTIVLTLDDATTSQYVHGLSIAEEFGITGTLYVPTQRVLEQGEERGYFMTATDVKEFQDAGWEIGSHTLIHENLLEVGPAAALETMKGSDFQLRSMIGDVDQMTFSYPYGAFDDVTEALAETVYSYSVNAWSAANGLNVPATFEEHNIHRFDIFDQEAAEAACEVMASLDEHQTYVVIVHEIVEEDPADWQMSTETYRYLLTCIEDAVDNGAVTKTVLEAANDLRILRDYGDPVMKSEEEVEVESVAEIPQEIAESPFVTVVPLDETTDVVVQTITPTVRPVARPVDTSDE